MLSITFCTGWLPQFTPFDALAHTFPHVPCCLLRFLTQAKNLTNSEELFKFLYKKGIGSTQALFWVSWATLSELAGRYPFTDK